MDIDMLKSSSSSLSAEGEYYHMDMMAMMMQMEKQQQQQQPPDFCDPNYHNNQNNNNSTPTFPDHIDFSTWGPSNNIGTIVQPIFHNPNASPSQPTLLNSAPTSSVSFIANPIQEPNVGSGRIFQSTNEKRNSMAAMREMIFRIAAMQPIHIDPESVKPPKRRNVKISKDPQSVAARHRRERISERIRILQRLVPGGTKMDTASMLDEAIHYVKFLKKQVQTLEKAGGGDGRVPIGVGVGFNGTTHHHHQLGNSVNNYSAMLKPNSHHLMGSMQMLR